MADDREKLADLDEAFDAAIDASPLPQKAKDEIKAYQDSWLARYRAAVAAQPWVHGGVVVLVALVSFLFSKYVLKVANPAPILIMQSSAEGQGSVYPGVPVEAKPTDLTLRQRIFANHWRNVVERKLRYEGLVSVGGARKLTEAEIQVKLASLSDSQIVSAAVAFGVNPPGLVGESDILQFFWNLINWIKEHPEIVEAFLRILMLLLML